MTDNRTTPLTPIEGLRRGSVPEQIRGILQDSIAWIQSHWFSIAVAAGAAVLIFLGLHIVRGWAVRLCRGGRFAGHWPVIIGRAFAKTGNFFIVMTSARLVIGYANAPPVVNSTVSFLFTIAAAFQAAIWLREVVFGLVEYRTQAQGHGEARSSAIGIIRLLVTIALFAVAIVVVLSNLGVNVTGLVAGLGVGGIAIGLAAQGIFADLFAALAIIFDRPFRIGDSISYDKGAGTGLVEAIGLKSTRLRGPNGEERIIANRKLLDFELLNTSNRAYNRFKFDFVLAHTTPPETIRRLPALLREAVESQGYKLTHGGLNGFAPNGLSYDVEFQSDGIDFPPDARDKVAAAVLRRFAENGIAFSTPTSVGQVTLGEADEKRGDDESPVPGV